MKLLPRLILPFSLNLLFPLFFFFLQWKISKLTILTGFCNLQKQLLNVVVVVFASMGNLYCLGIEILAEGLGEEASHINKARQHSSYFCFAFLLCKDNGFHIKNIIQSYINH